MVIILLLLLTISSCSISRKQTLLSKNLGDALERYVSEYPLIKNECNIETYYELYFDRTNSDTTVCISAWVGVPGKYCPLDPVTNQPSHEIKGFFLIEGRKVVIYDHVEGVGYELYKKNELSMKLSDFEIFSSECSHPIYPSAWCYRVSQNSIVLIDKKPPVIIK